MKKIGKEILWLFGITVFSNVIVEVGEEEKNYMTNPIRFFGVSIVMSIIGGYLWVKIRERLSENDSNQK